MWAAAAVAGLVAGAVLMVLDLLWATLVAGDSPWRSSHLVAAILMGPQVLGAVDFAPGIVTAALLTHYVLGVAFGCALAFLLVGFGWQGHAVAAPVIGALFGLALYVVDFYGMTRVFPWLIEMRGWPNLLAHVVFGVVAAGLYEWLGRRT